MGPAVFGPIRKGRFENDLFQIMAVILSLGPGDRMAGWSLRKSAPGLMFDVRLPLSFGERHARTGNGIDFDWEFVLGGFFLC